MWKGLGQSPSQRIRTIYQQAVITGGQSDPLPGNRSALQVASSLDNICSGGLTRVPARQTTNLAISREAERDKGNTAPHLHRPVSPCPTPLPRSHAGSVESRVMAMAGRSHYDHITI